MIDRHYGHHARDGREHPIKLDDSAPTPSGQGRIVMYAAGSCGRWRIAATEQISLSRKRLPPEPNPFSDRELQAWRSLLRLYSTVMRRVDRELKLGRRRRAVDPEEGDARIFTSVAAELL